MVLIFVNDFDVLIALDEVQWDDRHMYVSQDKIAPSLLVDTYIHAGNWNRIAG